MLDEIVAAGFGENRSAVIRRAVRHLAELNRRAKIGDAIAASYRERPKRAEDDEQAVANAIAIDGARRRLSGCGRQAALGLRWPAGR